MKARAARGVRTGLAALAALTAGCAHAYEDPTTETYLIGAFFLLIGIAIGIAVIISLNEG